MSVFIETEETLKAIKAVVEHAERIENYYFPGKANFPGKDPKLNLTIGSFRMTFSFTAMKGRVYRHLSISVAKKGRLPHPVIAMEIGKRFGFDGSAEAPVQMAPQDDCVVIIQQVPEVKRAEE